MRRQGMIDREDMLELTRRMTPSRNCFSRIAGAYFDEEGYVDGTFNIHFGKLSAEEQKKNLEIAKQVVFCETNKELREYVLEAKDSKPGQLGQLLQAVKESELKNDGLLDVIYEIVGEQYRLPQPFSFFLFHGTYDVPLKASDKESLWESEEVYSFIIGAISPLAGEYEPGMPVQGFLYPAFKNRSGDSSRINIYDAEFEDVQ